MIGLTFSFNYKITLSTKAICVLIKLYTLIQNMTLEKALSKIIINILLYYEDETIQF